MPMRRGCLPPQQNCCRSVQPTGPPRSQKVASLRSRRKKQRSLSDAQVLGRRSPPRSNQIRSGGGARVRVKAGVRVRLHRADSVLVPGSDHLAYLDLSPLPGAEYVPHRCRCVSSSHFHCRVFGPRLDTGYLAGSAGLADEDFDDGPCGKFRRSFHQRPDRSMSGSSL
jgi:hypothetical protein